MITFKVGWWHNNIFDIFFVVWLSSDSSDITADLENVCLDNLHGSNIMAQ